jgi:membrane associated rhomboid family serine protease
MLPLRDNIRSKTFPVVNTAIIVVCSLVFLWQWLVAPDQGLVWAFVPRALISPGLIIAGGLPHAIITMVTSAFLHGSLPHVGINMLFLWVFGDNVEDRMGHWRYLLFYTGCAVAGSMAHALLTGFSDMPLMGASGAIAGIMGAYFVLFRLAQIRTLVIIIVFPIVFDLPAPIFLVYWFFLQLFAGVGSIGLGSGTAFWAHVGGFAAGYFLVKRFAQPLRPPPNRLIRPRVVDLRVD